MQNTEKHIILFGYNNSDSPAHEIIAFHHFESNSGLLTDYNWQISRLCLCQPRTCSGLLERQGQSYDRLTGIIHVYNQEVDQEPD